MKVGFFFDLRNPAPWRRAWGDVYAQAFERIEEADRRGAGGVWFTEHHGWEDGYLPQPLAFAAAAAARTTRIRIGTAVLIAPFRHARHIAEEAAIVDIVSGGRLELGVGAGWSASEFTAFGVDRSGRFALTERVVGEVRQLLADGTVAPPPIQDPIPLWLGYQSARGARRAGELGVGLLSLDRALVGPYTTAFDRSTGGNPRMGGLVNLVVVDDPEAARERVLPHVVYQLESYRRLRRPDEPPLAIDTVRTTEAGDGPWPSGPGISVCTPDQAIAELRRRTEGVPVEHVYVWASVAGMPDDLVERHIELVCDRVAPALAA